MERNGRSDLTALDWIGAVVACFGSLFCAQFPFLFAPTFQKMFDDFGGPLPTITQLGLSVWFPLLLGAVPLGLVLVALIREASLARRRALIVAAFVSSCASAGVCVYSMYVRIFSLASSIK